MLFKGAFGDWFSWQNTLQRSAPLMLTALCVAIPARAGLVIIGGEGALVLGGLACAALPYALPLASQRGRHRGMICLAGAICRCGAWIMPWPGWLRQISRHQRDHQQPAAGLRGHRRSSSTWVEGRAARPGQLEQAVDAVTLKEGLLHHRHRRV